ncbi:MAG TPA: hypothetical protein VGG33_02305 [Polyangia bacterium]
MTYSIPPSHRAALLSLAFTLLLACGEHEGHNVENPFAEACEHLGGTGIPVTATSAAAGAPAIATDHKRYDVKLVDNASTGSGKSGVVSFNSAAVGHIQLFLSADVPVTVTSAAGAVISGSKLTITSPCTQLKAAYEFAVAVGRHDLTLGGAGTTVDTVSVVAEAVIH